ncbi:hypothetical protein AHiyo1_44200 [Arthrobacter sp. Hiyo1]|uniref:hypothetical protein n=1 Tax=Arthrobacter sp. Hiyo1 TaxID=1588020 RepID=UPI0006A3B815|nr:hypothetical protein [Arthrobacter sp. Hiyo1]GAP60824.1 hypothetical protein AHiyo1_44200 [Arthrobacter sp. Hiyo1]
MTEPEKDRAREALERAMDDLLEGRVPGPLTGLRLVELAGVKRHRLTHDNPDLNLEFQERARQLNRIKPEVESLRKLLFDERERNAGLVAANRGLDKRLKSYATALLDVLEERDSLRDSLSRRERVIPMPR